MSRTALAALFALLAFAANSILCRMALRQAHIDPASFTSVRLLAGALTMWILVLLNRPRRSLGGDWGSALALLAYAVAFSFAYVAVTAGTGALLLFGAVQLVMISVGLLSGERMNRGIAIGWALAVVGLVILVIPGVSAAPLLQASFMLCAGVAWAIYSLRGRRSADEGRHGRGNLRLGHRRRACAFAERGRVRTDDRNPYVFGAALGDAVLLPFLEPAAAAPENTSRTAASLAGTAH